MGVAHSRLVLAQLAFIILNNIPSQENEFYGRQMLSNEVSDLAAEWSESDGVWALLQQLLGGFRPQPRHGHVCCNGRDNL